MVWDEQWHYVLAHVLQMQLNRYNFIEFTSPSFSAVSKLEIMIISALRIMGLEFHSQMIIFEPEVFRP